MFLTPFAAAARNESVFINVTDNLSAGTMLYRSVMI